VEGVARGRPVRRKPCRPAGLVPGEVEVARGEGSIIHVGTGEMNWERSA
jgi:hypothetical protein